MANSLSTLNGKLIAQRTLDLLLETFPILTQITSDFSSEASKFNQEIEVQTPGVMTAQDYDTTNGYVVGDATQTEIPLTIDKHKHVTFGFNDQERTSTAINLIDRFAGNAAHALGKAMVGDLMALVVSAKFTNASTIAVGSFTRNSVLGIGKVLNARKVPESSRFMVLNGDYYEALAKDSIIVANAGSPSGAVRSRKLGNVDGFETSEYSQLPGNSQNLVGFAGVPEGLVIATRVPIMPDPREIPGKVETYIEEKTKLSLQMRTWYDMGKGKEFRTLTIMYGVAAGTGAAVQRIVSA